VSLWDLYHKSNEVSVETFGSIPSPKSIKHIEPTENQGARLNVYPENSASKISNGIAFLTILSVSILDTLFIMAKFC